jgi:hypothetical protein
MPVWRALNDQFDQSSQLLMRASVGCELVVYASSRVMQNVPSLENSQHSSWPRPGHPQPYLALSVVPSALSSEDGLGFPGLEVAHAGSQHTIHQQGLLYMLSRLAGGHHLLLYASPRIRVILFIFISTKEKLN